MVNKMAAFVPSVGLQGSSDELIRTQFATREGTYRLLPLPDYTRSLRLPLGSSSNLPVRLSFVIVTDQTSRQVDDLMCFNINRELHVYRHDISDKVIDIIRPVEKKFYQCTFPTCHDFNQHVANPDRIPLLIGFANGQIHLLNLAAKEFKKSFNVDQLIDKSKVTCVRWVPGSKSEFVVSHASGQLYIYDESLPCVTTPPTYQSIKQGLGFSIHTCKTKVGTRNPKFRWYFNDILCINEVAFSPCTRYIAIVSQDGFLRVFNFQFQEVVGAMKSYFGGLRCVCWSPDSKYIVTGGEDDLVTVWSLAEKRVICRYVGHKSWVSVVAFDPWTTILSGGTESGAGASDNTDCAKHFVIGDDQPSPLVLNQAPRLCDVATNAEQKVDEGRLIAYRFASVSEDTHLCLWELTEDNLVPHVARNRLSTLGGAAAATTDKTTSSSLSNGPLSNSIPSAENHAKPSAKSGPPSGAALLLYSSSESSSLSEKYASLSITEQHQNKESKRPYGSLGSRLSDMKLLTNRPMLPKAAEEALKHLGVSACPQLNEVPMLNPLVCKKIARERLTGLAFRENSIVTVCQEGIIRTWSRPGNLNNLNGPVATYKTDGYL